MQLTVSVAQAEELAQMVHDRTAAIARAAECLRLLSLGHVPPGAVLESIDTDTGVLTFQAVPDGD